MLKNNYNAKWKPLGSFRNDQVSRRRYGIYTVDDFLELLHYERKRSDRSSTAFSLVVFDVGKSFTAKNMQQYVDGIKDNSRTIDHIGWFDESSIGVLLPATHRANAMHFASNISTTLKHLNIRYTIYSYPTHWNGSALKRSKLENPIEASIDDRVSDHIPEKLYDSTVGRIAHASETLKSLFARRMPLWKRAFDIIGSATAIVALSPLLIGVALLIKIVSRGPVFYTSQRVGHKGENFKFLKFRTMRVDNNQDVHGDHAKDFIRNNKLMQKLDGLDPRIIPGGRVLRKLAIDELPQLYNIFKGDMSFVGPRPCIPYEAEEYLRWQAHRFDIVPGLTGLWQVSGKNNLTFQQMIRLDIAYSEHISLWSDLMIIMRTPIAIARIVMESLHEHAPVQEAAIDKRQAI